MTAIPEGVPQGLTVGQVARVLNLHDSTIKHALKSGALQSWRIVGHSGWRYVRPEELARFAGVRGLIVDWGKLEPV